MRVVSSHINFEPKNESELDEALRQIEHASNEAKDRYKERIKQKYRAYLRKKQQIKQIKAKPPTPCNITFRLDLDYLKILTKMQKDFEEQVPAYKIDVVIDGKGYTRRKCPTPSTMIRDGISFNLQKYLKWSMPLLSSKIISASTKKTVAITPEVKNNLYRMFNNTILHPDSSHKRITQIEFYSGSVLCAMQYYQKYVQNPELKQEIKKFLG